MDPETLPQNVGEALGLGEDTPKDGVVLALPLGRSTEEVGVECLERLTLELGVGVDPPKKREGEGGKEEVGEGETFAADGVRATERVVLAVAEPPMSNGVGVGLRLAEAAVEKVPPTPGVRVAASKPVLEPTRVGVTRSTVEEGLVDREGDRVEDWVARGEVVEVTEALAVE